MRLRPTANALRRVRSLEALRESRRLDASFYRRVNPDVAESGLPPRLHFIAYGFREGRAPSREALDVGRATQRLVGQLGPPGIRGIGAFAPESLESEMAARRLLETVRDFTRLLAGLDERERALACAPTWRFYGHDMGSGLAAVRMNVREDCRERGRLQETEASGPVAVLALQAFLNAFGRDAVLESVSPSDCFALAALFLAHPAETIRFIDRFYLTEARDEAGEKALLTESLDEINAYLPFLSGADLTDDVPANAMHPRARELAISLLTSRLRDVSSDRTAIIALPWVRMGGSDKETMRLAEALSARYSVVLLSTVDADAQRVDWVPDGTAWVSAADLLGAFAPVERADILYGALSEVAPRWLIIANSADAHEAFRTHGERLSSLMSVGAMLFCFDGPRDEPLSGHSARFGATLTKHASVILTDGPQHRAELIEMFAAPEEQVRDFRTPHAIPAAQWGPPVRTTRPVILWAGRNSRQKRLDLALSVALVLPEFDFHFWGFEATEVTSSIPSNVQVFGRFTTILETRWDEASAFFFTSSWEGLPNILLEAGSLGMPIVASSVGSVPALIDHATGWRIEDIEDVSAYAVALREVVLQPDEALRRGRALRSLIEAEHAQEDFDAFVDRTFS